MCVPACVRGGVFLCVSVCKCMSVHVHICIMYAVRVCTSVCKDVHEGISLRVGAHLCVSVCVCVLFSRQEAQ